jgi:catechol 1,2-dioxygenase
MSESDFNRRKFLKSGLAGLGIVLSGQVFLKEDVFPTEISGDLDEYLALSSEELHKFKPTEDNILGPFHVKGAPFRGKISPPSAKGEILVIKGTVWGFDTKKPLKNTLVDIWQADSEGNYDYGQNTDKTFYYRARLITDENGYYEYETIHPGAYKLGQNFWRPPHIHYLVRHENYKRLITQLYFRGDPHQKNDSFIKNSLIIDLQVIKNQDGSYNAGVFDIVLEPD